MNPQDFFNIASYLYNLSIPDPQVSSEIIRRTYVNRAYYYLYHLTRNETIAQLQDTNNFGKLPHWLEDDHIVLEKKFKDHKILRHFYQGLYEQTGHDNARKVHHILSRYNTYRILADYYIDTHNPSIGHYRLNFQNPDLNNPSWKELLPHNIARRGDEIIQSVQNLFLNQLRNEDSLLYKILNTLR